MIDAAAVRAAQRKVNVAAGLGSIVDAEVEPQREMNESEGYGRITDAQVAAGIPLFSNTA